MKELKLWLVTLSNSSFGVINHISVINIISEKAPTLAEIEKEAKSELMFEFGDYTVDIEEIDLGNYKIVEKDLLGGVLL